jgi:hypothetical protein
MQLPVAPSSAAPPPATPSPPLRRSLTHGGSPGDARSLPAAAPSTRELTFDAGLPIRTPNSSRARAHASRGGRCASPASRRLATQPVPVVGLGGMASAAVVRSTLLLILTLDAQMPIRTPNSSRAKAYARRGGICVSSACRRRTTQPVPVVGLDGMASAAVVRSTLLLTPHPRRANPLSTQICQFARQIPVAPGHLRAGNAGARRDGRCASSAKTGTACG